MSATPNTPVSTKPAEPMRWHELKTDPEAFDAVVSGAKTCEIRRNDRDFKVGDGLLLRRTKYTGNQMHMRPKACPLEYTGEECRRVVSHIVTGYGLENYCALSLAAPATPVPLGGARFSDSFIRAYVDEAREVLDEAYGFAAMSPRGRENINAALALLDDIDAALNLAPSPLQAQDAAPAEPVGVRRLRAAVGMPFESLDEVATEAVKRLNADSDRPEASPERTA